VRATNSSRGSSGTKPSTALREASSGPKSADRFTESLAVTLPVKICETDPAPHESA
jgi:hypothetical protein